MSARRSRFKVAANIPVRRKYAASQAVINDSSPDKNKCETNVPPTSSIICTLNEKSLSTILKHKQDEFSCSNVASTSSNALVLVDEVKRDYQTSLEANAMQEETDLLEQSNQVIDPKVSVNDIPKKTVLKKNRPQPKVTTTETNMNKAKNNKISLLGSAPEITIMEIEQEQEVNAKNNINDESIQPVVPVKISSQSRSMTPVLPQAGVRIYNVRASEDDTRRILQKSKNEIKGDNQGTLAADLTHQQAPPAIVDVEDINNLLEEENVDDPDDITIETDVNNGAPVLQVKIDVNGEIIVDEKSLTIETTAARKRRLALEIAGPFIEDRRRRATVGRKRRCYSKKWTPIETQCFYKALNCLGTNFNLMEGLFPDRTRTQLKAKFKREEKHNCSVIDCLLSHPGDFNMQTLQQELNDERNRVKADRDKVQKRPRATRRYDFYDMDENEFKRTGQSKLFWHPKNRIDHKIQTEKRKCNEVNISSHQVEGVRTDDVIDLLKENSNTNDCNALLKENSNANDCIDLLTANRDKTVNTKIRIKPPARSCKKRQIPKIVIDNNLKKKQTIFRVESNVKTAKQQESCSVSTL